MKKFILIFAIVILALISKEGSCQVEASSGSNKLHTCMLKQSPSSEFSASLKSFGITADTAILILLPPMSCPRCEGIINTVVNYIKQKSSIPVYLIVEYEYKSAVNKYLQRRLFVCDKAFVTDKNKISSFFSFSTGYPQVPFIIKTDTKQGTLLFAESLIGGEFGEDFVQMLLKSKETINDAIVKGLPSEEKASDEPLELEVSASLLSLPKLSHRIRLNADTLYPLSKINYLTISDDELILNDDLSLSLLRYKIKGQAANFVNEICPTPNDETLFLDTSISPALYNYLKSTNIANTMFFKPQFIDKDSIAISASLPKIIFNRDENNIEYYNTGVILAKSLSNSHSRVIFNSDSFKADSVLLSHINYYFDTENQEFYFKVNKKSLGNYGCTIDDSFSIEENSFTPEYYKRFPILAIYNKSGNLDEMLFTDDTVFRYYKSGYSYVNPIVSRKGALTVYTDGFSGNIYIKNDKQTQRATVFNLNVINIVPEPTIEYISRLGDKVFKNQITDLLLSSDDIKVLVANKQAYKVQNYTFDGKLLKEFLFLRNNVDYGQATLSFFCKIDKKNYLAILYNQTFTIEFYLMD